MERGLMFMSMAYLAQGAKGEGEKIICQRLAKYTRWLFLPLST